MQIIEKLLTRNRPYTVRNVTKGIVVHYVGNPNTTAIANRNYFQNTKNEVSSNYVIGLEGEIIACVPHNEVAWCSNNANPYTISIECCHPKSDGVFNRYTYNSLVELCSDLCLKYNLNPLNGGLLRHFDITGKVCPMNFVPNKNGGTDDNNNSNWKKFINDVYVKMYKPSSHLPYFITVNSPDGFLNVRNKPSFINSQVVSSIKNSNIKYTIVEETKDGNGNTFGKLKSGIGYVSLNRSYVKIIH